MKKTRKRLKTKSKMRLSLTAVLILCFLGFIFYYILPDRINTETSYESLELALLSNKDSSLIEKKALVTEKVIDHLKEVGPFELPISGASGYASVSLQMYKGPGKDTKVISMLEPGEGFTILTELNNWWRIDVGGKIGWVMHKDCFVNLPDIIPSIIYKNTNSYSSQMVSSGKKIPNITGEKLYNTYIYNERFDKKEHISLVAYSMASKINLAQQAAIADGNTLIIYEAFRPYDVQQKILKNLRLLVNKDLEVKRGVTKAPWSIQWFLSTKTSNHQKGYAIDVSLGKVISKEKRITGSYIYNEITKFEEYEMPTDIHELSAASITFNFPISSILDTEWKNSKLSNTMNNEALLLQKYCTRAELTPLASEWWHFNDLDGIIVVKNDINSGKFFIEHNYSTTPNLGKIIE